MATRRCRLNILTIDFETYYDKQYSLSKLTTEAYITHDDQFEVIGVAVKQSGQETQWFSGTKQKTKEFLDSFDWANSSSCSAQCDVRHAAILSLALRYQTQDDCGYVVDVPGDTYYRSGVES